MLDFDLKNADFFAGGNHENEVQILSRNRKRNSNNIYSNILGYIDVLSVAVSATSNTSYAVVQTCQFGTWESIQQSHREENKMKG